MASGSTLEGVRRLRGRAGGQEALEATRRSLLTRLRSHEDQEGWQRFFDTYGGAVRGLALKAGLSGSEADDVLQETLVSVAGEMPGFRYDPERGSFKAWLFRIARRRIADQFRRRARQRRDGDESGVAIDEHADPSVDPLGGVWEEEWRSAWLGRAVERVKARVASRQWQMFDLVALREWPVPKVCAALGVNRAQIYMARLRVGRQLRVELEAARGDGPIL